MKRPLPLVVAVIGTSRSGTSCTAGIVHHLGVSMGENLRRPNLRNPKGFFEDRPFRRLCPPRIRNRVRRLRRYALRREGAVIGVKDAKLCNLVPDLVEAFPKLKVIAVDRPLDEIVASMTKAGTFRRLQTPSAMRAFAQFRINQRDGDLAKHQVDTLRLPYHDTLADPRGTILKIIEFLGIEPTKRQRRQALRFVDPHLRHQK